jgi:hypothetical protein
MDEFILPDIEPMLTPTDDTYISIQDSINHSLANNSFDAHANERHFPVFSSQHDLQQRVQTIRNIDQKSDQYDLYDLDLFSKIVSLIQDSTDERDLIFYGSQIITGMLAFATPPIIALTRLITRCMIQHKHLFSMESTRAKTQEPQTHETNEPNNNGPMMTNHELQNWMNPPQWIFSNGLLTLISRPEQRVAIIFSRSIDEKVPVIIDLTYSSLQSTLDCMLTAYNHIGKHSFDDAYNIENLKTLFEDLLLCLNGSYPNPTFNMISFTADTFETLRSLSLPAHDLAFPLIVPLMTNIQSRFLWPNKQDIRHLLVRSRPFNWSILHHSLTLNTYCSKHFVTTHFQMTFPLAEIKSIPIWYFFSRDDNLPFFPDESALHALHLPTEIWNRITLYAMNNFINKCEMRISDSSYPRYCRAYIAPVTPFSFTERNVRTSTFTCEFIALYMSYGHTDARLTLNERLRCPPLSLGRPKIISISHIPQMALCHLHSESPQAVNPQRHRVATFRVPRACSATLPRSRPTCPH